MKYLKLKIFHLLHKLRENKRLNKLKGKIKINNKSFLFYEEAGLRNKVTIMIYRFVGEKARQERRKMVLEILNGKRKEEKKRMIKL